MYWIRQDGIVVHPKERSGGSFRLIGDAAGLADAFARSHQGPVVLFNYDPTCGINGLARQELERLGIETAIVDVARHHHLGRLVARQTGVEHESPQVIVLRDGRAVWDASHFAITAAAVAEALRGAAVSSEGVPAGGRRMIPVRRRA